uniref:ATP synthase subunit b, chloroplastic n=1 Tax=Staurocarteria crucifera TaxID=47781 RepID=A0A0S2IC47_9CHLO|nr:CF0 subunit I of ATP synthase [Carteria crucifera]
MNWIADLPLGHGHGFGFNDDIFETNIINLAVVVGVVVTFVGKNLTSLLEDRKKTILNNLQEANLKATEAQQKLTEARNQLELAKKKAKDIREEGVLRATQEIQNCVREHELRIARLDEFKQETIQFYQQKAYKQAYGYFISRIMTRVREKLNKGIDSTYQIIVNNFYVTRFTDAFR